MAEVMTHYLEPVVNQLLEGLDEPLREIKGLIAKTDADFIDGEGSFNPKLKKDNDLAISGAIEVFNEAIQERGIGEVADASVLSPVERAALFHVTRDSLALRSWNPRLVGKSHEQPLPDLVESVDDLKPTFFNTADKLEEVVRWWRNDAPYFAYFGNDSSACIYPAYSDGNVTITERGPRYSNDVCPTSDVLAVFAGGKIAAVLDREDVISKLEIASEARDFELPILGWSGPADRHGKLKDFGSAIYDKYSFINENGYESEVPLNDKQLYAARVALASLRAESAVELPDIELPKPSDEFCENVIKYLAHQTVRAFLPAPVKAKHGNRGITSVHRTESHIRGNTEAQLKSLLRAAGAGLHEYPRAVQTELGKMRGQESLGGRIDAIKAQKGVDEFLGTLGFIR